MPDACVEISTPFMEPRDPARLPDLAMMSALDLQMRCDSFGEIPWFASANRRDLARRHRSVWRRNDPYSGRMIECQYIFANRNVDNNVLVRFNQFSSRCSSRSFHSCSGGGDSAHLYDVNTLRLVLNQIGPDGMPRPNRQKHPRPAAGLRQQDGHDCDDRAFLHVRLPGYA